MPGDDIQRQPVFNAGRAITLNARAEEIWPWLVQMGYRRGVWYGYRPDRQRRHSQHREGCPGVAASEGGRHRADMAEPGFPGGGALSERYLVFASPNKHESMALGAVPCRPKPYAAGLAHPPGPIQLGVAVDRCATLCRSGALCGGAAKPARNQSSCRRPAPGEAANCVRGAGVVSSLFRDVPGNGNCFVLRPLLAAAGTG